MKKEGSRISRRKFLASVAVLLMIISAGLAVENFGDDGKVSALPDSPLPGVTGSLLVNDLGMEFVWIEPGSFLMGNPSGEEERDKDETLHRVTLSRGFYMQTTEITQAQWQTIMGDNPSNFNNCGQNCPVERVSWDDAQEFIRKLNLRVHDTRLVQKDPYPHYGGNTAVFDHS